MGSSGSALPIRTFNVKPNPYWGMVKKNTPQGAVFVQGQQEPEGFEGGFPQWIYVEMFLAASDSQDLTVFLPDNFTLFGLNGYAVQNDGGGFAFQMYDEDRGIWLMDRLTNHQAVCGFRGNVKILREPYSFKPERPQLLLRVANLSTSANDIQLALFGVAGGAQS